jgi:hypothetical protein
MIFMKTPFKLLAVAILAGGSMFAQTRFSVGINIGTPRYYAPPPVYSVAPAYNPYYMPPMPGPGYTWVSGYWNHAPRRAWVAGYWRAPVRYYAAPRYYNSYRYAPRGRGNAYGHRR